MQRFTMEKAPLPSSSLSSYSSLKRVVVMSAIFIFHERKIKEQKRRWLTGSLCLLFLFASSK